MKWGPRWPKRCRTEMVIGRRPHDARTERHGDAERRGFEVLADGNINWSCFMSCSRRQRPSFARKPCDDRRRAGDCADDAETMRR